MEQTARVAKYFDQIARDYKSRYESRNPYHNFFFRQRLNAAIEGFSFDKKSVLDIGAGTGQLYSELVKVFPAVDYYSCDISAQMLEQSIIPAEKKFVGQAHKIPFSREFDFIFSLGVTTYQTPSELTETLRFVGDVLAPGGVSIVSFTNRSSIDHLLRNVMKVAKPLVKRGVFAQSFGTYSYSVDAVKRMAADVDLKVAKIVYLNQTFSPFNTLLPNPSIALGEFIERNAPAFLMPTLSSDFIAFVERVR